MLNGAWLKRWLTSVDDEAESTADPSGELEVPVARCSTCAGAGQARGPFAPTGYHEATTCWVCAGSGVVRAQYVVTLIDLPTGRVASRNVVPAALTPLSDQRSLAYLDLGAAIRELAASLGVEQVYDVSGKRWVERDLQARLTWPLHYACNRVLSTRWQTEYEAVAIAQAGRTRPQLLLYSGVDLDAAPDPDEALRQLLAASTDLDLDLVVDVRADAQESLRWAVCLAVPGSEVAQTTTGRSPSLRRALTETTVATALTNADKRSAPGRWPATNRAAEHWNADDDAMITWAELSARLTPLALPGPGAIGVYRNGEWFLSSLETVPDQTDDLKTILRAKNPAPEPAGELIPVLACQRCHGEIGSGCYQCRNSGTELAGAILTITNLRGRAKHVIWHPTAPQYATVFPRATASPPRTVSGFPLRPREVRLDEYYSVGRQAEDFGVPPHLLRDLATGRQLERSLVDGKIGAFASDPVSEYLRAAGRRRPGGRVIVFAGPEPRPLTGDLLRSIVGLGLTLSITVQTAPTERESPAPTLLSWRLNALSETAESSVLTNRPASPTLAAAAAHLQIEFDTVVRQAMQVGTLELLPVPQQPLEVPIDVPAISSCLQTLGTSYPDTEIRLCRKGDLWTCSVGQPYLLSTSAETLDDVVAGLLHPEVGALESASPEDSRPL